MLMGDFETLNLDFSDKGYMYWLSITSAGFHDTFIVREVNIVHQSNLTLFPFPRALVLIWVL